MQLLHCFLVEYTDFGIFQDMFVTVTARKLILLNYLCQGTWIWIYISVCKSH